MRFVPWLIVSILIVSGLRGQSGVPVLAQSIPAQPLAPGGPAVTIDLRNYFAVPGVAASGVFAQFDTVLGRFNVELRPDVAPRHVANFLSYAQSGAYVNTFFHRSVSFEGGPISVVQGGGYRNPPGVNAIPRQAPVPLEYSLPNARGTIGAARGDDINSATSEWYFNVRDNSTILGQGNAGGYTAFGRVTGTGMSVVDAIAALPRTNAGGPLTDVPVRNFSGGALAAEHFVIVNSIRPATLFPTGGGVSVIELSVENSAPEAISTLLSGSTLTLTPLAPGSGTIVVRAIDSNGNAASASFAASVASTAPVFTAQPAPQTVAAGTTVVFNAPATGAASFRWERNGEAIPGATSSTLVLNAVTAAHSGVYVAVATNSLGSTTSNTSNLVVQDVPAAAVGRLVNLSILTAAGAGAKVLTVGAVVGPFDAPGSLPLLLRAVGPTIGQPPFNVPGVLGDPVMTFFAAGSTTPLDQNDDWGGSAPLTEAFAAVGAFPLPAGSRDSALIRPAPGVGVGGYTVQVTGKGDAAGAVLAEIYDATGSTRSTAAPRLINVSTLAQVEPGSDLAVGFVIGGVTARTVLVRGVGPSLSRLGVTGVMSDPRLELFNNDSGQRIGGNDDWAGSLEVFAAGSSVGAFPLAGGTTKDAALLVTLPPGAYSARLGGAGGTGGTAIVEVYEVP